MVTSKTLNRTFWDLEKELGIPVWENLLNLPDTFQKHPSDKFSLEQKLGFTYVDLPKGSDVFVSDKTDFFKLVQYLPFLFEKYQLFLCPDQLINERLRLLSKNKKGKSISDAGYVLDRLLEKGIQHNASDIHLESGKYTKKIRIRVDGRLENIAGFDGLDENIFIRIKLISKMDIAQKRSPQDGHFHFINQSKERFDIRVSSLPSINGEKIVMRILPLETINYSLKELGIQREHVLQILNAVKSKSGMVLIAGPTGSGKTTTLYAILKELVKEPINIMTIENPVEYRLDNVVQVEVNEKAGVSFSNALKSFLRQDPDVILIGEIRDAETAEIAARAAQTGHLVLSTVHSNTVFEILQRLKNLGVSPDDLSSSIKLMISQRLLKKRCQCKGDDTVCSRCGGRGYAGRVPIMESLPLDDELREMLMENLSFSEVEKRARQKGFRSMEKWGNDLVQAGVISKAELETVIL